MANVYSQTLVGNGNGDVEAGALLVMLLFVVP